MPLCAETKLVPSDKGEYDKDGAESQFQSLLPCLVGWLCRAENQGEITRRVARRGNCAAFVSRAHTPTCVCRGGYSPRNAESIIYRFTRQASLWFWFRDCIHAANRKFVPHVCRLRILGAFISRAAPIVSPVHFSSTLNRFHVAWNYVNRNDNLGRPWYYGVQVSLRSLVRVAANIGPGEGGEAVAIPPARTRPRSVYFFILFNLAVETNKANRRPMWRVTGEIPGTFLIAVDLNYDVRFESDLPLPTGRLFPILPL